MKRSLFILLCVLALPLAARASPMRDTSAAKLSQIERATETIRHLTALRPVKAVFLSDKQFDAAFDAYAHRNTPESSIEISQREEVLLGLLNKTDDLHRILFQNLSAQVGGFYDDHAKTLYVRNHDNMVLGLRRDLIAHEYTHALQDQHYQLLKLDPDESGLAYKNTDATDGAHRALIEGDAVNTQELFIYRTYSRTEISAFVKLESQPVNTPPLPKSIQRQFDFPYTAGLAFVQKLYLRGGMAGVDAAYQRLPGSTYEIVHPDAYLNGWKPAKVTLHNVQGFDAWKQMDDDVLGAFGYELLLWQYLDKHSADQITGHYRGDRYILLENGTQDAMLFRSVWTSWTDARAAQAALVKALKVRYRHLTLGPGPGILAVDPDGAVYFRVAGTQLTMAYAPTAALAQQLGTAATS